MLLCHREPTYRQTFNFRLTCWVYRTLIQNGYHFSINLHCAQIPHFRGSNSAPLCRLTSPLNLVLEMPHLPHTLNKHQKAYFLSRNRVFMPLAKVSSLLLVCSLGGYLLAGPPFSQCWASKMTVQHLTSSNAMYLYCVLLLGSSVI